MGIDEERSAEPKCAVCLSQPSDTYITQKKYGFVEQNWPPRRRTDIYGGGGLKQPGVNLGMKKKGKKEKRGSNARTCVRKKEEEEEEIKQHGKKKCEQNKTTKQTWGWHSHMHGETPDDKVTRQKQTKQTAINKQHPHNTQQPRYLNARVDFQRRHNGDGVIRTVGDFLERARHFILRTVLGVSCVDVSGLEYVIKRVRGRREDVRTWAWRGQSAEQFFSLRHCNRTAESRDMRVWKKWPKNLNMLSNECVYGARLWEHVQDADDEQNNSSVVVIAIGQLCHEI
jgi:hypothetical protein